MTVPRWRPGVPASLNKVVRSGNPPTPLLQPFPSWQANRVGDCAALQYVQSMEILPRAREMWIIDVGRLDINTPAPRNLCPAKLVILDLDSRQNKTSFAFGNDVVSQTSNFLNDIVVDPRRRVAYISNVGESSLVVFNSATSRAWKLTHSSMRATLSTFKVNGVQFNNTTPVDGLALAPDFSTLFYCALSATKLYSIPTSVLRDPAASTADFNRAYKLVGNKHTQTDGMIMSNDSLYFGSLADSSVLRWKIVKDMEHQGASYQNVRLFTLGLLRKNSTTLHWPDTFAIDTRGFLWIVSNRLNSFFTGSMRFDADANFRIWRVRIDERSYLAGPDDPTHSKASTCALASCLCILMILISALSRRYSLIL